MTAIEVVVVGGSAGSVGPAVELIGALGADSDLVLVVVIHRHRHSDERFLELLGQQATLPLREPDDKTPIAPGAIWVAPANYHLLLEPEGLFGLSVDPPVNHARPAIDPTLETAATLYGPALCGVILSGANTDGSRGLARVAAAGGRAIVQDPATAQVGTMPAAALAAAAAEPLPAVAIVAEVARYARLSRGRGTSGT